MSTCATLTEWPAWMPTESEKQRLGVPGLVYRARKIRWARAPLVLFQGNKKPFTASMALISRNISVRRFPWFYPHHQRGSHRPDTAVVVLARPDSRSVDLTSQYSFRHAAHRLSVAGVPLIFPVHSTRTLNGAHGFCERIILTLCSDRMIVFFYPQRCKLISQGFC